MEDWEDFFAEKSRRRADKERRSEQRERMHGIIAAVVIALLVLGGIAALAVIRP